MNRIARIMFSLVTLAFASASVLALDEGWPRTLALDEGLVTIYQPQIEALDEGVLYYRAALAYRPDADSEPIFGAGWLKAPVDINEKDGIVHPSRLELTQARFPDGTADIQAEIATTLLTRSANWNLDFSVAELESALDAAEAESLASQKLKTAPPKIFYRDHPALLVTIDGDPVLRDIENSPYKAVINTPYPLITDGDDYFLNAAKGAWYRASFATGPYRFDSSPPGDIVKMVEDAEAQAAVETRPEDVAEREPVTAANAPEIVVTTQPAELIVTDGPADFVPLVDDLLVLKNSDDDVFMDVGEQKYYIVLAGRWYRADSLDGPWEFRAADALPSAFAEIPIDSDQADSRVYVAGTPEAEDAVLDAQVPQTAAVKRGEVDIDVDYDGEPDFEPVDGTDDLRYATNSGATVLESDRTYYLLEDGVWYVSESPNGPWVVSDHRPGELDEIEPSSPVYNTKYVYVYDSTPSTVYVGYTPGYLGSYVYYDTIVYGTGWYYRPWVSPYYYYPRYSTWGFHVGYSDWGGWSFGLSWYWPGFGVDYWTGGYWHYGHPWYNRYWGYWGPRGYRYRPYYHGHRYSHHGYRNYDRGYKGYARPHDKYAYNYSRAGDDFYRGTGNDRYGRERNRNLYRDDHQRARVNQTRDVRSNNARTRNDRATRQQRGEDMRIVNNRKIRQSTTGPVHASDLRAKAQVRDVNRAASREPMVASLNGEVHRATAGNTGPRQARNRTPGRGEGAAPAVSRQGQGDFATGQPRRESTIKSRQSHTTPISRDDLRQRGEFIASRDAGTTSRNGAGLAPRRDDFARAQPRRESTIKSRQSHAAPISRTTESRSNRQFSSQPRRLEQRAPQTQPSRRVNQEARASRSSRQATAPRRETISRAPESRPSRQIASPPRQVEQRAPQARPGRQASAPSRREQAPAMRMQSRAPSRQMSAPPSRPQQSAPAPRPQQRSAPPRNAPQPRGERGGGRGDGGGRSREHRRND